MPQTSESDWDRAEAAAIIETWRPVEGAALPMMQALQEAFGFVPDDALPMIADALNLSRADVHGIKSFYHDFRSTPPGRHVLKLCRAEACQSMGGDALAERARARLRIDWGETTADGAITLEPVFCLGLCACAPAAMNDGEVVGRLNETRLDALLSKVGR